jgi:uncharacterized phage protein gp47/JayE
MADYGITPTGFVPRTQTDILAALQDAVRARLGASLPLGAETVLGQLLGIVSERLAEAWEALEGVYASRDPDAAEGAALDALAAITGTVRLPATASTVPLIVLGTPGTLIPAGRVASVPGGGPRFETLADVTIVAAAAWQGLHVYAVGERVVSSGNVYEVISVTDDARSWNPFGPSGTGQDIVDNHVHWRWLGAGAAFAEVDARAQQLGPVRALAGTITNIETPSAGWAAVRNAVDALPGRDIESDVQLRMRRTTDLRQSGNAALDSIRSRVLSVANVTAATVFENPTGSVVDGMPPFSIEALVTGGDPPEILQAIWDTKAAGIQAFGSTTGTAVDSMGATHPVAFSRPTDLDIWVSVNVLYDASLFPSDGTAQIQRKIAEYGTRVLAGGRDVVASSIGAQAFAVSGVFDVPSVLIGAAFPPTSSSTIVIAPRQIARLDTSRIIVVSTAGTL